MHKVNMYNKLWYSRIRFYLHVVLVSIQLFPSVYGLLRCCARYETNLHTNFKVRTLVSMVSDSSSMDWSIQDSDWIIDANTIDYIQNFDENDNSSKSSLSFDFLREEIGLNISREISARTIVPHHLTTASDVFCNREVNMQQIKAVGFDMDWTLAQYTMDFDLLAYNGSKQKMVEWLGYPTECLDLQYELNVCRRGNIIDKKRGNIIKLDQHKYVRVAEHGLTPLTSKQRKATYQEADSYSGPNYSNIDTPFSLVDACLFSQLVDLKDRLGETDPMMSSKSYSQLWTDLRRCVDRCHRDGVIKLQVAADPSRYIIYDPNIFPMLDGFRRSGRKVFLLTNSLWDYTQVVMNYLFARKVPPRQPGDEPLDLKWAEFFDIVIVGGNKPAFLIDEGSLPMYVVEPTTGGVRNVEVLPSANGEINDKDGASFLKREGRFFQGGNAPLLHTLLGIAPGEGSRLLYVGDHVYADIVRSKRTLGWRTCLIVPELTRELRLHKQLRGKRVQMLGMRKKQFLLEMELDALFTARQRAALQRGLLSPEQRESNDLRVDSLDASIRVLSEQLQELRGEVRRHLDDYSNSFHPRWGQLFKAGFQESRIAKQIKDYACLYTSRASNLGLVSPMRPFRPIRDMMPHDHILETEDISSVKFIS